MQNKDKLSCRGICRRDSQPSLWYSRKASNWLCETWGAKIYSRQGHCCRGKGVQHLRGTEAGSDGLHSNGQGLSLVNQWGWKGEGLAQIRLKSWTPVQIWFIKGTFRIKCLLSFALLNKCWHHGDYSWKCKTVGKETHRML